MTKNSSFLDGRFWAYFLTSFFTPFLIDFRSIFGAQKPKKPDFGAILDLFYSPRPQRHIEIFLILDPLFSRYVEFLGRKRPKKGQKVKNKAGLGTFLIEILKKIDFAHHAHISGFGKKRSILGPFFGSVFDPFFDPFLTPFFGPKFRPLFLPILIKKPSKSTFR